MQFVEHVPRHVPDAHHVPNNETLPNNTLPNKTHPPQQLPSSTPHSWTAPEVLDGQRPSYAADVYALGIIMYEVLSLLEPFGDLTSVQVITRVLINKQRPPIPGAEDSEYENPGADRYVTLMQRCWHIDPQERPSMEEIDQEFRCVYCVCWVDARWTGCGGVDWVYHIASHGATSMHTMYPTMHFSNSPGKSET